MTNQHPITPPPELVGQWLTEAADLQLLTPSNLSHLATQAAQWGADQQLKLDAEQIAQAYQKGANQELEACCAWLALETPEPYINALRTSRRPKPPTLKEQALRDLDALAKDLERNGMGFGTAMIRRAIEALPND